MSVRSLCREKSNDRLFIQMPSDGYTLPRYFRGGSFFYARSVIALTILKVKYDVWAEIAQITQVVAKKSHPGR